MPPAFYDVLAPLIADEPHTAGWMLGLAGARSAPVAGAVTLLRPGWPRWPDPHDADAQVRLEFADGTARIAVCKVLSAWNEQIRYSLPAIMGFAFEEHRLPVCALLVCGSDALADRYRAGVDVGPDSFMAVTAVGPAGFPDLATCAGPWSAPTAVAAAAVRRGPAAGMEEPFVAALDRWLGAFEPERAAAYAEGLLGLLDAGSARLLREVAGSGARPYHAAMGAAPAVKGS